MTKIKLSNKDYKNLHYAVAGELVDTPYKTAKFDTLSSILQKVDNHQIDKLSRREKKVLTDYLNYVAKEQAGNKYGVQYKTLERAINNKDMHGICPEGYQFVKAYHKSNGIYVRAFCRKK